MPKHMSCNMTSLIVDCIPAWYARNQYFILRVDFGVVVFYRYFMPNGMESRMRLTLLQTLQNFHPLNKKCKKPAFQSCLNLMTLPGREF